VCIIGFRGVWKVCLLGGLWFGGEFVGFCGGVWGEWGSGLLGLNFFGGGVVWGVFFLLFGRGGRGGFGWGGGKVSHPVGVVWVVWGGAFFRAGGLLFPFLCGSFSSFFFFLVFFGCGGVGSWGGWGTSVLVSFGGWGLGFHSGGVWGVGGGFVWVRCLCSARAPPGVFFPPFFLFFLFFFSSSSVDFWLSRFRLPPFLTCYLFSGRAAVCDQLAVEVRWLREPLSLDCRGPFSRSIFFSIIFFFMSFVLLDPKRFAVFSPIRTPPHHHIDKRLTFLHEIRIVTTIARRSYSR